MINDGEKYDREWTGLRQSSVDNNGNNQWISILLFAREVKACVNNPKPRALRMEKSSE